MIDIKIDSELDYMKEVLSLFTDKRQKYIIQNTVNDAAFHALKNLRADTARYIDRPIPFTVNSSRVFKATQANLVATIDYKSGAGRNPGAAAEDYLKPGVYGGERRHKRFEAALIYRGLIPKGHYVVPSENVALNQYGNVKGSLYTTILSFVGATYDTLQQRNLSKYAKYKATSKAARKKDFAGFVKAEDRKRERAARYYVFIKGQGNWTGGSGVYERTTTLGGKRNSSFKLIFHIVSKVSYRKTFPFYEILNTASKAALPEAFKAAVTKELQGMAKRKR
jgi:hypothetical protein